MKTCDPIERAKTKAMKSLCRFKIAAIGEDYRGRTIDITFNSPKWIKKHGGTHAEMALMRRNPKSLYKIYILRINKAGDLLPIHACSICQRKADELGVKIIPVK
jgi:hypothetical protein